MQIVRSEMVRNPEASRIDGQEGKLKWNYTTGLELKAFLDVYDRYGNKELLDLRTPGTMPSSTRAGASINTRFRITLRTISAREGPFFAFMN